MDVRNSQRGGAIDGKGVVLSVQLPGLVGAGEGVGGDVAHIFLFHQFFQRGGAALVVVGKAVDLSAQREEILAEYRLASMDDHGAEVRYGECGQNQDDRDHGHHFQKREAASFVFSLFTHRL